MRIFSLTLLAAILLDACSPAAPIATTILQPTTTQQPFTATSTPPPPARIPQLFDDYELTFSTGSGLWELHTSAGHAVARQAAAGADDWEINYMQLAQDERISVFDANTFPETYKDIASNWLEYTENHTNAEIDAQWEDYQQFVEAARAEFLEREGITDEVVDIKDINPELQSLWGIIYWAQNNRQEVISGQMMPIVTPSELRTILQEPVFQTWSETTTLADGTKSYAGWGTELQVGSAVERWYKSSEIGGILGRDNIKIDHNPLLYMSGDLALLSRIFPDDLTRFLVITHWKSHPEEQGPYRHRLFAQVASFDTAFSLPQGTFCYGSDANPHAHKVQLPQDVVVGSLIEDGKGNPVSLENLFNNFGANVAIDPPAIVPGGGVHIISCLTPDLGMEIAGRFRNKSNDLNMPRTISPAAWPWQSQANSQPN